MRLTARTLDQIDSPIVAAYALLSARRGAGELLDMGQAAPSYPPAPVVVEHVVAVARDPRAGGYVPSPGLPKVREAFAADLNDAYQASLEPDNVLMTAGANQAFCVVTSALAEPRDEFILPLPFYFNHDMWLRLEGFRPVYLEPGPDAVPLAEDAERLITDRTRAIVLVSPSNPSGLTMTPADIGTFADLARHHGIALIIDETYRSFRDTQEPAHQLFSASDWADTVVSLHSCSKDLAIPGYRVGAVVGSRALIGEAMKLLDCMAICPPRIGQEAAWAGLTGARDWRRDRAREVAAKHQVFLDVLADHPGGFEVVTSGAYFGWVRHPFTNRPTGEVVRELALEFDTLVIPGTAFLPDDRQMLRVSFSNLAPDQLVEFGRRLVRYGDDRR